MSNAHSFDFAKFVPGFDFLKNLTPGATPQASGATSPGWVAPTLDPEELEKRIQELKTVQFWLEQNAKAVGATIQALEVQRMTLATLKGMNMSFQDLADSLKVKTPEPSTEPKFSFTQATTPEPAAQAKPKAKPRKPRASKTQATGAMGVDPSQWWGALTDQFQHIAHHAMKDMGERANAHMAATAANVAKKTTAPAQTPEHKAAHKTSTPTAAKPTARKATPRKAAPRKSAARKSSKR
jgi:hypothetical protein